MAFSQIADYDGYFINQKGVVLSKKWGKERILKPAEDAYGYYIVNLCKNKKPKSLKVHRLVALTFIANPNNYPFIDHIDRNPKNNCVSNLRWCNQQMNLINTSKYSTNTSGFKNISFDKASQKYQVFIMRKGEHITGKRFDTIEEAILYRNAVLEDLGERHDNIDY